MKDLERSTVCCNKQKWMGSNHDKVQVTRYFETMSRPERVEYEGAYYHVMNRGRGRQSVFHGEKYSKYFLQCLACIIHEAT